ncbi:mavicyanin-like [Rosa rugosa]|uniref:mavicyanin-like n=1 Tax=Rosa rugosa TaxID=74645 RepID=UPI002B417A76|nr:mavicyanin-like [Rosa rugosa]
MAGYNNITAAFAVMVIAFLVFRPASMVVLADYIFAVGEDTGWNDQRYDYQAWADNYFYNPGDTLFFLYDPGLYDVVVAGSAELFDACSIDHNLGFYHTGRDELVLPTPGTYYFFDRATCKDFHMKFYVNVN